VPDLVRRKLLLILLIGAATVPAFAQRLAVIAPQKAEQITEFHNAVRTGLSEALRVLDPSLAEAAFKSIEVENPFNLTTHDGRRVSSVVGCDSFLLIRSAVQRREVLSKPAHFEAYAVIFLIDGRSGRLIDFALEHYDAPSPSEAQAKLIGSAPKVISRLRSAVSGHRPAPPRDPGFEEVPPADSPLAKGLRTPVPYRRIRPEYTDAASFYGVRATVDIEVDIDVDGRIARTSIERWAGFGLEESVEKAVRAMNWRPAERNGKPLPMRVLLRYNFTKIEKDETY